MMDRWQRFMVLYGLLTCMTPNYALDTKPQIFEESSLFNSVTFMSNLAENLQILIRSESELRIGVSDNCLGVTLEWLLQVNRLFDQNSTTNPDLWALQMFDAFAKVPEGILTGHVNSFGDYDECVGLRARKVTFSEPIQQIYPNTPNSFDGQYCTTTFRPAPPAPTTTLTKETTNNEAVSPSELLRLMAIAEGIFIIPSMGMCFPSICSRTDIGNLTRNALVAIGLGDTVVPTVSYCATGTKPPLDAADYSVIALLGVLIVLCLVAGMVDMYLQKSKEKDKNPIPSLPVQYLLAFSFYTNIRKWLNTRSSGDDLGCIHGIRFISTTWVVLGHTWYMLIFVPAWNMVDVKQGHEDWSLLTVLNSTLAVDTFFVMSGMLVTYNLLKLLAKTKGKFNVPLFYIHRYLRITPTYAILVGIMATLMPYVGAGPYWFWIDRWGNHCSNNWWTNLIYVNNFVNTGQLCQGESWYLACDMQFYLLAPLFIYPIWRWKKVGLSILGISIVGSILCPALLIYFAEPIIPTTIMFRYQGSYFRENYMKPYTRIQTYLLGIALGYLMYVKRGQKVHLHKGVVVIGWILAAGVAFGVLFGIAPWFNPENEIPDVAGTIYGGLNRFSWGLSVSWVIFACVKGYGGLINDFLSWKVFIPLGRLCFCVFLVSLHLQMALHLMLRQPMTYDVYIMTNFFLAHVLMSFLVGFLCTLAFESPFITLEKLIFDGGVKRPRPGTNADLPRPHPNRNGLFYEKDVTVIDTEQVATKGD